MSRILRDAMIDNNVYLAAFNGGRKDNAIPLEMQVLTRFRVLAPALFQKYLTLPFMMKSLLYLMMMPLQQERALERRKASLLVSPPALLCGQLLRLQNGLSQRAKQLSCCFLTLAIAIFQLHFSLINF